ncbi:30S ribosomal protein S8e [Candidatus Bathyarchaeota archaeon]|jgi:small subunit ribosomal protein S8e|nr:30S ribosomal protein S8e [Candidatus Bathyarchaeota archaeon]MDP6048934.1 30S ribosomal protein S8e [Candidatus Bathyarchaeota archaeon]MDP6458673.1 30S ribosomal protein S8e [Candidatus Bathyarchaeota archaeon]MDP7207683.1 30S ribosomal protein S8e [Candidatus Bathyarchaeota archaeon]MDP7443597.1 30S ribosomal protein S8e [Candidatus Bathyarchaeota archaeon]|tara:strand:- start:778 stop:1164 length:387 start_codon:yes stop_codon:yes gene_type:complete
MAWQSGITKRKKTGGKKRAYRSKRLRDAGSAPLQSELGNTIRRVESGKSRLLKVKLFSDNVVNVSDPSTGTTERLEIRDVVENPANIDYNRRGVITKGAIVRTDEGLAKIVSRPGQHGVFNAIVIKEE